MRFVPALLMVFALRAQPGPSARPWRPRQQPHSHNENLRPQNLWDGIETMGALLAMD